MSSDQEWLIRGQKVPEIYGPCFWEKLEGEGKGREDSDGFLQDAQGYASVASANRESGGQVFSQ